VTGIRQVSLKNFYALRNEILKKYINGEISSKVYVVRGLLYADQYYLQYSGSKGGSISFTLKGSIPGTSVDANASFSAVSRRDVGYEIDGSNGGVLGYRVSGIRFNRHMIPLSLQEKILDGMSESDVLDTLSFTERSELIQNNVLEIIDLTDEIVLEQEFDE
jgi:hypothetical protein